MKQGDCKLPIQEDHRAFLKKKKLSSYSGSKKVAIIASILLLIAMSLMIVVTFQSITGIKELRQEVDYLKNTIKGLQKKIDEEIHRDGTNLPKMVKNEHNRTSEDLNYDYDYVPNDYYDLDDNDENEEYYDEYNDSKTNIKTGENYTKDAKQATPAPRIKRSITGYAEDGEQYVEPRRRNITYRKAYPHHFTTPPSYPYPFYRQANSEDATSSPQYERKSRIMQYFNQMSEDPQNTRENADVEIINDHGHTRHRQRRLEFEDHQVRTGRMRPLPSAHFSGDTSKYVLGQHDNFNGNGHLRHPQRTFVDWAESSWFRPLGMDQHFSLSDGLLTIKDPGLYFIYAQIYYYDQHDLNGFRVYRNESETLLQCTTMTHSAERVMKSNTCFTAAAEYLNDNDRISLGDLSDSRYSLFEPGKSFFGVIKLGDVRIK